MEKRRKNPVRYKFFISSAIGDLVKVLYGSRSPISLTELCNKLNKKKSTVSELLNTLRDKGLLIEEFKGKEKFFSINERELIELSGNEEIQFKQRLGIPSRWKEGSIGPMEPIKIPQEWSNLFDLLDVPALLGKLKEKDALIEKLRKENKKLKEKVK